MIIQVPRGGEVHRRLTERPPLGSDRREVVVEAGEADREGNLEPPAAGEVVLSVPSPEAISREADEVRRVLGRAPSGVEPPVVVVEAAEDLSDQDLEIILEASRAASQPVIGRIIRNA